MVLFYLFISYSQLDMLRSLKMNNTMYIVDNFRPLQELYNRTVKASFTADTTTSPPNQSGIALKISNAVLLSLLFGAFLL